MTTEGWPGTEAGPGGSGTGAPGDRGERWRSLLGELVRFGAAGVLALGVDVALFASLVWAGVGPLVANPVSMGVRLGIAFLLTRNWVFEGRGTRPVPVQIVGFLALAAANIAVTQLVLWVALTAAGGSLSVGTATAVKVVAIGATFLVRFAISRRVVFGERGP